MHMTFLNPRTIFQPCVHHNKRQESKFHHRPVPVTKRLQQFVLCSGEVSSLLDVHTGWSNSCVPITSAPCKDQGIAPGSQALETPPRSY